MSTKTKPGLLLAESWDGHQQIGGWWASEKLDGLRAYWDGQQFLSRDGNRFHAPEWFTAGLPTFALDGELWLGRRQFEKTAGIVRRKNGGELWLQLRFVVFDAPGFDSPFEHRQYILKTSDEWQGRTDFANVLEQWPVIDSDHLRSELTRFEQLGAEGLMLRQPGSRYTAGRSATLLKVKTFHDAEAVVIAHETGTGRNAARVGALIVQAADGRQFGLGAGLSDTDRQVPPPIGATVTYRYQELTAAGLPRFPTFLRVREY